MSRSPSTSVSDSAGARVAPAGFWRAAAITCAVLGSLTWPLAIAGRLVLVVVADHHQLGDALGEARAVGAASCLLLGIAVAVRVERSPEARGVRAAFAAAGAGTLTSGLMVTTASHAPNWYAPWTQIGAVVLGGALWGALPACIVGGAYGAVAGACMTAIERASSRASAVAIAGGVTALHAAAAWWVVGGAWEFGRRCYAGLVVAGAIAGLAGLGIALATTRRSRSAGQ